MLSTKKKVEIARFLSKVICAGRRLIGREPTGIFTRSGISYSLDLREGIDLSIYLFGAFEPDVVAFYSSVLKDGSVAIDIGANVGAHTVRMANFIGDSGKVIAIEPTDWAFEKLARNVDLNPKITHRVKRVQGFLGARDDDELPEGICSSWPLDSGDSRSLDVSLGRALPTTGARVVTLAGLCAEFKISHIDLIKLDVDGHEIEVLEGGRSVIERYRPAIIIELAPYVFPRGDKDVVRILELLLGAGYSSAVHGSTSIPLGESNAILRRIPENGGINVMIK